MEPSKPVELTASSINAELAQEKFDSMFFLPKTQKLLFRLCIASALALQIEPLCRIFHLFGRGSNLSFIAFILAFMLLLISSPIYALANSIFSPIKTKQPKLNLRKWPCSRGAFIITLGLIVQWILSTINYWNESQGLFRVVNESLLIGAIFPATGLLSYWLGNKFIPNRVIIEKRKQAGSLKFRVLKTLRSNLTQVVPYISLYNGFLTTVFFLSFMPNGIGQIIGSFLLDSMRDANIVGTSEDPTIISLASGLVFNLITVAAFSPLVTRLSAGYQSLLNNFFNNKSGEDALSVISKTIDTRLTRIPLPEKHPHIRSAFETLFYLVVCYSVLFAICSLSPSSPTLTNQLGSPLLQLSLVIQNWLTASLVDANFDPHKITSMRYFLAAFVAAIGVVPVAVSGCVFLPMKKESNLFISPEGLLIPGVYGRKMHFWSELKRVSIDYIGTKNERIKLKFGHRTISLETKKIEPEKQAELLAIADEQAHDCIFEKSALQLRTRLGMHKNSNSLAEHKQFESTIFTPHSPGETVKDYRIIRKLLSKPLSAVYLVRLSSGQMAVLKQFVTPVENEKTAKQRASFMQEYELLKKLDHPKLASVIDAFEDRGSSYIAIEHIAGIDLRKLVLIDGKRKENKVISWALEICEQLKYMHSQSPAILHRDLTPDNLMLDDSGNVRIIDFGAAHQFMEGVTGTLIGKQSYIAPEQLRGKPSQKSDIYSLGATMYFLLRGEDPKALQQADLEFSGARISKDMIELVRDCTAFEEVDRPDSIDEIIERLQSIAVKNGLLKNGNIKVNRLEQFWTSLKDAEKSIQESSAETDEIEETKGASAEVRESQEESKTDSVSIKIDQHETLKVDA